MTRQRLIIHSGIGMFDFIQINLDILFKEKLVMLLKYSLLIYKFVKIKKQPPIGSQAI